MTEISDAAITTPFGPPPRAATPRVKRRAWADPTVRFWWLLALALLAASIYLAVRGVVNWRHEEWLRTLPTTPATIAQTDRETVPNRPVRPGTLMELRYPAGGRQMSTWVVQRGYTGEPMTGQTIPVHVNPNDPADLTIRNTVQNLPTVLAGGFILLAIAVGPLVAAVVSRAGILKTWRTGDVRVANILGGAQTPLAPGSRRLRCTWADASDRTVFNVYVPTAVASAETIELVARPTARPLAAAWFE